MKYYYLCFKDTETDKTKIFSKVARADAETVIVEELDYQELSDWPAYERWIEFVNFSEPGDILKTATITSIRLKEGKEW